jgi:hypothetical protein
VAVGALLAAEIEWVVLSPVDQPLAGPDGAVPSAALLLAAGG